jgi:stage IV sporulation protein FB
MFKNLKLFNFKGVSVSVSPLFFLLLLIAGPVKFLVIFLSIMIHEMAHAFVALRKGWSVAGINIGLFFGSAEINTSTIPERDSLPITLAGPVSNFCLLVAGILGNTFFPNLFFSELVLINLILFLVNLLPIYPLDGGRALRDILILTTKNRRFSFKTSSIVSLSTCVLILFALTYLGDWIQLIFSAPFLFMFSYMALKELKVV